MKSKGEAEFPQVSYIFINVSYYLIFIIFHGYLNAKAAHLRRYDKRYAESFIISRRSTLLMQIFKKWQR